MDTRPRVREGSFAADDEPRVDDLAFLGLAWAGDHAAERGDASATLDAPLARVPPSHPLRASSAREPTADPAEIDALDAPADLEDLESRSRGRGPRVVEGAAGRGGGTAAQAGDRRGADADRSIAGGWRVIRQRLAIRLPVGLRGAVVTPAASATLVLAMVALAAAVTTTWLAWRHRPVAVSAPATVSVAAVPAIAASGDPAAAPSRGDPPAPTTAGRSAGVGEVVVDVAGRVSRPGVVRLTAGSRVIDAIDRVGGALPGTDTTGIALARVLVDGEQILVDGRPGPPPAAGVSAPAAAAGGAGGAGVGATAGDPIDLNNASAEQLDGLPGVGPVLAQRIVQWRTAHGPFRSADQLGEVTGVGDRRLADLLPLVRV